MTFQKGNKIGVRFKKGVSGNPHGRGGYSNKDLLRQLCLRDTEEVYEYLMNIIRGIDDKNIGARVSAIRFHQEAGWGKAPQAIHMKMTNDNQDASLMTTEQLDELTREAMYSAADDNGKKE
jgi:hypothetical protein